ncbi:heparin lyase I family protein [Shumkonia mesophila]|uniref:heparin lyase I family protein n=1 Tax=Shumkonia mesophila TaxID=2838854 RepID=UPI0029347211|nr:heparin lyase I family protein [Shumkonia mesophila]
MMPYWSCDIVRALKIAAILCAFVLTSCDVNPDVNPGAVRHAVSRLFGHSPPQVQDGFETSRLDTIWSRSKFLPDAVEMQSSVVRAGMGAVRITLHGGDQIPTERGSGLERAELMESWGLWTLEDLSYEYVFSLFVPPDFPVVPVRLVLAQWKQDCPIEDCNPNNPVIAIRYVAGELRITHKTGPQPTVLYRTQEDIRGRWLDFRFQIRFSQGRNGRIRAWLGDEAIIDYRGVNAYPAEGGYTDSNAFYFKMGLYRDLMAEPMTVYADEYRKRRLPDDAI